jgi:hypothetical protein
VAGIEGLKFLLTDCNRRGNRLQILFKCSELPFSTAMPLSHTGAHVTMSQKTKLYKATATLHITFREHGHTKMIIRTTVESPYIRTDVM